MPLAPMLRSAITYLWQGPSSLPQALQLEWRFVAVRWLGIIFMAPGLMLAHLAPQRLVAAYLVLALAVVYNLTIQVVMLRRPGLFVSGYMTAVGDSLLNIAMINVGGGFNSPFYYLLFTVTISAAMRYGYGPALATVLIFVGLDAIESSRIGHLEAPFVFRSGFLCITAVLAGYLREQARRAETALEERLRQANLLNAAAATLAANLEFEPTLHAVASAACQLFDGVCAVLQPVAERDGATGADGTPSTIAHHPWGPPTPSAVSDELRALCCRYAGMGSQGHRARSHTPAVSRETLPCGQPAIVLILARPTRGAASVLAVLAVLASPGQQMPRLDPDILDSFAERTLLAIENASLYRTVASRTEDLQRAYGDLAAAHQELLSVDEMKTNFLANVSHELRTPLSSIRSFSELLLSYDDDPAVQREFAGIINSESERLTRLVNDVLDITKIESGKMDWHMTTVDLTALLGDSARTYATLIDGHHLIFRQRIDESLPRIYADRDRLQQVIGNLLNNAVKFTSAGTITLRAACHGDEVHIAVADTGVGIAADDHERIFEKFQQVGDTLTDKPKGTGLGLCICRDIVAHHNGRLWVESRPGAGSVFTIALPIADAASAESIESTEQAA